MDERRLKEGLMWRGSLPDQKPTPKLLVGFVLGAALALAVGTVVALKHREELKQELHKTRVLAAKAKQSASKATGYLADCFNGKGFVDRASNTIYLCSSVYVWEPDKEQPITEVKHKARSKSTRKTGVGDK